MLFCSVVTMAKHEKNDSNDKQAILVKTLKEVQRFKKDKNKEIQKLKLELSLLKKRLNITKKRQNKEIKVLQKKVKISLINL